MSHIKETFQAVSAFLGSERIEDLKNYVVDELKENLHDTIHEYYLIWPDDVREFAEGLYEKSKKDIAKKYKAQLDEELSKKVERYLEELRHEDRYN